MLELFSFLTRQPSWCVGQPYYLSARTPWLLLLPLEFVRRQSCKQRQCKTSLEFLRQCLNKYLTFCVLDFYLSVDLQLALRPDAKNVHAMYVKFGAGPFHQLAVKSISS
jgi:hypothetical protein